MKGWSLALVAGLFAACGAPEPQVFIALDRDFADYAQWEMVAFDAAGLEEEGHPAGQRRVFRSAAPPAGATEWPVGTRFVKEMEGVTLAMAKRGGGYNAHGAVGWEWFELGHDSTGAVRIRWRGLGPPAGSEYSDRGDGCNTCHASSRAQLDGVLTPAYRLMQ